MKCSISIQQNIIQQQKEKNTDICYNMNLKNMKEAKHKDHIMYGYIYMKCLHRHKGRQKGGKNGYPGLGMGNRN